MTHTNQQFCYWLQGYFEISRDAHLIKETVLIIDCQLKKIKEPLGHFTQWLFELTTYLADQNFDMDLIIFFTPVVKDQLNSVFYHVIDNSYDTLVSHEERKRIHDGLNNDQ